MSSRAITTSDVTWIVKIMFDDTVLVQRREVLCLALGISLSQLTDIARDKHTYSDTYLFLTRAFKVWISSSTESTFQKLFEVLNDENFNSTAAKITKKLTELTTVETDNSERNLEVPIFTDIPIVTGSDKKGNNLYGVVSTGKITPTAHQPFETRLVQRDEITYGNPRQIDRFMVRQSIMDEAKEALQNGAKVIVFTGQAGSGKTQEAIHFALSERHDSKRELDIILLPSENITILNDGLRRFSESRLGLAIPLEEYNMFETIVSQIRDRSVIFVLDNVSEESVLLQIPLGSLRTFHLVLVTTQFKHLSGESLHIIQVREFELNLARKFYSKYLSKDLAAENVDIERLITEIGTIPLFVQLTCSFLNNEITHDKNYSVNKFLYQAGRMIPTEYFKGTVGTSHNVPQGGPSKVWQMVQQKIQFHEDIRVLALEILSVISYLQPDGTSEEFILKVLRVSNSILEKSIRSLTDSNIINRRVVGTVKFISADQMVLATVRDIEASVSNHSSLEKILNLYLENDIDNSELDNNTKQCRGFLSPHFHTVIRHVIYSDALFSKFHDKVYLLWVSKNYMSCVDVLFQLEVIDCVVKNELLLKSKISDWFHPFLVRYPTSHYSVIEDPAGFELYNRIFLMLQNKPEPELQRHMTQFSFKRAENAFYGSKRELGIQMFKEAYAVALDCCHFTGQELMILHSLFYMVDNQFYLSAIKSVYAPLQIQIDLENIFGRFSKYYQVLTSSNGKLSIPFAALSGAKRHLEETGQDAPTLLHISSVFIHILDQGKFQLHHSVYLENVLRNLRTERYKGVACLHNFKKDLESKYEKYKEITHKPADELVNVLFEHLYRCVCAVPALNTCDHDLSNLESDKTIAVHCEAGRIVEHIVKAISTEIPNQFNIALKMLAYLDVGAGNSRYHNEPVIRNCNFPVNLSCDEILAHLDKYGIFGYTYSDVQNYFRRVEDIRPQKLYYVAPYYLNQPYTKAYSRVMELIRLECKTKNERELILRHVLQGLDKIRIEGMDSQSTRSNYTT